MPTREKNRTEVYANIKVIFPVFMHLVVRSAHVRKKSIMGLREEPVKNSFFLEKEPIFYF